MPTGTAAQRLADDLQQLLPPEDVELFPAWETLPFERVSPSVEAMGRRLRVLWRLQDDTAARRPRIVVAGIRALLQRLGPDAERVEPEVVRPGQTLDAEVLLARLVAAGYRREELVEHRGEVARRGSIIDVFPSTADAPVRIDLWGDEVDRLTEFSVHDQRSTDPVDEAVIVPARELQPTAEVRARAERLVAAEPWGREQWERLAEGLTFDGMESWLPWLVDGEELLTDRLPSEAQVILVEPRRLRDRAADVLAEEADLATTLARTWGAGDVAAFPRLHLPAERLLTGVDGAAWSMAGHARLPRHAGRDDAGVGRDAGRRARPSSTSCARCWPTATGWSSPPRARARRPTCHGSSATTGWTWRSTPGARRTEGPTSPDNRGQSRSTSGSPDRAAGSSWRRCTTRPSSPRRGWPC